jgi:RNA polymerase sigma-70 factor (ECF subfamily)
MRDAPDNSPPLPEDHAAIQPAWDGRAVFEILAREHADLLTAYLRSLVGNDPSIDDLFQQSMLVAWRRLNDYDRSRPFGPWLRGIAQRLVLEHHRRRAGRPTPMDPAVLAELDRRFDTLAAGPGDTFRERAERVMGCLAKLPEAMRNSIELVYARGMLIAAAAAALGSSEEAVKKRVQRGRQLLAQCLAGSGFGDEHAARIEPVGEAHS